jgi:hypothetical protein
MIFRSIADLIGNVNTHNAPLEEEYFNSPLYKNFLNDGHFHHSEKGCDIEIRKFYKDKITNRYSVNKYCKTHNKLCSKTGWELNWYMGTYSLTEGSSTIKYCKRCGKEIRQRGGNRKYCRECSIQNGRERALKRYYDKKNKILK